MLITQPVEATCRRHELYKLITTKSESVSMWDDNPTQSDCVLWYSFQLCVWVDTVKANSLEPMRGRINHPYLTSGCVGLALLPSLHTRQLFEFSTDSSATRALKSILIFKLCSLYSALKCMSVFDPTGTYSSRDVCCTLVNTSGTTLYVLLCFSLSSPVIMWYPSW